MKWLKSDINIDPKHKKDLLKIMAIVLSLSSMLITLLILILNN